MLEALKRQVCHANLDLAKKGLAFRTWGNVSGIDGARGLVVIKPSGVPYDGMKPEHMVIVSLETGKVVQGRLKPSSDTPTHLALFRAFHNIGGVAHTHSLFATAWAQAQSEIPPLGTSHADFCHGPIPCTRPLSAKEIQSDYEANTGRVIVERYRNLNPLRHPAVLVACHGPFTWGNDAQAAVNNAAELEFIARLASESLRLSPKLSPIQRVLLDKHFLRKHGSGAYYGQE